jgi:galactitol-specific phosphotransferase system IIC component
MLMLAAFATVALFVAGLCAVLKGDTFVMVGLLVVLLLIVLIVAPQVPTLMTQLQHAIDARMPIALR